MAELDKQMHLLADLTFLAEKYGHPEGPQHTAISYQFPFKSGLTPLLDPPFATDQEAEEFKSQEQYQRWV